jgi:hypothetical protein
MRIMILGVKIVREWISHIVHFEFLQGTTQWFAMSEFDGKMISLEFEPTGQDGEEKRKSL